MKKKILLVICLISCWVGFAQANFQGKITYRISTKKTTKKRLDSVLKNTDLGSKKMNIFFSKMMRGGTDVEGFLQFSNGESIYQLEDKMIVDGKRKLNITRMRAGASKIYYRNTITNNNFYQTRQTELLLIESIPIKWKITQETKKIGIYICYKAIDINSTNKKQQPIAWFTPQIPVNFGPHRYFGLPGLILEVDTFGLLTTATSIVLNPKKKIKIKKPTKGKKITAKEYLEITKKFFRNLDREIKKDKTKN